jgi:hypothetical protein
LKGEKATASTEKLKEEPLTSAAKHLRGAGNTCESGSSPWRRVPRCGGNPTSR